MPTYQYACKESACGHRFEAVQSFSDEPIAVCPVCEGQVRKVFSAVGVVFKGSGFYRTDSRENAKASSSANGSSPNGSGEKKSEAASSSSSGESSKSSSSGSTAKASASSGSSSGSTSKAAAS